MSTESDTPLTDEMSRVFPFGYENLNEDEPYVDIDFAQQLERAYNAACAFIDCHVADPDITDEMVKTHAIFTEQRAALAALLNKTSALTDVKGQTNE
jgi:hypothetical protein